MPNTKKSECRIPRNQNAEYQEIRMPNTKKSATSAASLTRPLQAPSPFNHFRPEGASVGESVANQPPACPALKQGCLHTLCHHLHIVYMASDLCPCLFSVSAATGKKNAKALV
jgi:hypothetical protein